MKLHGKHIGRITGRSPKGRSVELVPFRECDILDANGLIMAAKNAPPDVLRDFGGIVPVYAELTDRAALRRFRKTAKLKMGAWLIKADLDDYPAKVVGLATACYAKPQPTDNSKENIGMVCAAMGVSPRPVVPEGILAAYWLGIDEDVSMRSTISLEVAKLVVASLVEINPNVPIFTFEPPEPITTSSDGMRTQLTRHGAPQTWQNTDSRVPYCLYTSVIA